MSTDALRVGIIGAATAQGRELVDCLGERCFPVASFTPFGGLSVAGSNMTLGGQRARIELLANATLEGFDVVFMCGGPALARRYAAVAAAAGAVVVDTSSAFRTDDDVPLVVPEVNAALVSGATQGILASPCAAAIGLAVVLSPLQEVAGLRRVVVSTYQAVSGTGRRGIDELSDQISALMNGIDARLEVYPKRIAFNSIPVCGKIEADGETSSERHVRQETAKVLRLDPSRFAVHCVRVPMFHGYGIAVNVELEGPLSQAAAHALLRESPGLIVSEVVTDAPTPADVLGSTAVHVGRIRRDESVEHGLAFWVSLDNLRKGAATNAVQIGEVALRDLVPHRRVE